MNSALAVPTDTLVILADRYSTTPSSAMPSTKTI